jgi:acyl-CoA synthetase (NDP forming)
LSPDRARDLAAGFLAGHPDGGWLPLELTLGLLRCYGVPLADRIVVTTEGAAVAAAARIGGPVALRADVPGPVRKREAGAVLLDLHGPDEVRQGFRTLQETFRSALTSVIVQPMVMGGVEVKISVLQEREAGPLVLFGLSGAADDVLADRAARLTPLTSADADRLIRSIRAAPLLPGATGEPGAPGADLTALRDMLLRISRMADDLPQIAELELSPVVARPDGVVAVDGRIRLAAVDRADADLRRLP